MRRFSSVSKPIRHYFYQVDLHGRLFVGRLKLFLLLPSKSSYILYAYRPEPVTRRNVATCLKDGKFLNFFFSRITPTSKALSDFERRAETDPETLSMLTHKQNEYPYVSLCGGEVNFIKPDSAPIVFNGLLPINHQSLNQRSAVKAKKRKKKKWTKDKIMTKMTKMKTTPTTVTTTSKSSHQSIDASNSNATTNTATATNNNNNNNHHHNHNHNHISNSINSDDDNDSLEGDSPTPSTTTHALRFGHNLWVPFEPDKLYMCEAGMLYHPAPVGLLLKWSRDKNRKSNNNNDDNANNNNNSDHEDVDDLQLGLVASSLANIFDANGQLCLSSEHDNCESKDDYEYDNRGDNSLTATATRQTSAKRNHNHDNDNNNNNKSNNKKNNNNNNNGLARNPSGFQFKWSPELGLDGVDLETALVFDIQHF